MHPPASLFEQLVSKPRLDSYRHYWKVTPDEAVGLYMWNVEVSAEVAKLLSHFEVVLRNSVHRELSLNTTRSVSPSAAWWNTLRPQLTDGILLPIDKELAKPGTHSADEIVSRLTFGVWPNVLTWVGRNRSRLLSQIFPAHPLSAAGPPDWANKRGRGAALNDIFEIKLARNRVSHSEPLWKFPPVMDTSVTPPVVTVAGSTDEASTLARFTRLLSMLDKALSALNPHIAAHILSSSGRQRLDQLLTIQCIERYKKGFHVLPSAAMSAKGFQQQLACIVRTDRPVRIHDSGGAGIFFPSPR